MNEERRLYTVSEITRAVRRTLEVSYGRVRVRGEISGWRPASSGHTYFILKDADSQLRAVLFRGDALSLRFTPRDGIEVEAEGELTVYEARGDLQLLVRRMAPSGVGALLQALEVLKRKLAAEGLFDPARKRPLPAYPLVVGVITSPTGAAIRDILKVLGRRWPVARIVFHPVPVQGAAAAQEIARALDRMSRWGGADVILVGRGGGSLEDLWSFNEEPVVRAVAASVTPVISAVGHEIDVTLADLAADLRAPTPSAAAELAVPDLSQVSRLFAEAGTSLARALGDRVARDRRALEHLVRAYGFRRPERFLERSAERLDALEARLGDSMEARTAEGVARLEKAGVRLRHEHPARRMAAERRRLAGAWTRLSVRMRTDPEARRERLEARARALRALDPGGVLGRGYALVRAREGAPPATAASMFRPGDPVLVQFLDDRLVGRVDRTEAGGLWSHEANHGEENPKHDREG